MDLSRAGAGKSAAAVDMAEGALVELTAGCIDGSAARGGSRQQTALSEVIAIRSSGAPTVCAIGKDAFGIRD